LGFFDDETHNKDILVKASRKMSILRYYVPRYNHESDTSETTHTAGYHVTTDTVSDEFHLSLLDSDAYAPRELRVGTLCT
jgi:hypothetical protein